MTQRRYFVCFSWSGPRTNGLIQSQPANENGEKTVPCPYCDRKFRTIGGVGSHLESRGCHPELSHESIWRAILEKDFLNTAVLSKVKSENEENASALAVEIP